MIDTSDSTEASSLIPNHLDAPVIHTDPEPPATVIDAPEASPRAGSDGTDEFTWRGVPLHPFSSSRSGIFYAHRLAMGGLPILRVLDDVDAWLGDAFTILWLCSHQPDEWAELRRSPVQLQLAIDAWADANVSGSEAPAAVLTAMRIYAASRSPAA